MNLPVSLAVPDEFKPQHGCREEIEQLQRQLVVAAGQIATEVNAESEFAALERSEVLLDEFVEFVRQDANGRAIAQIL